MLGVLVLGILVLSATQIVLRNFFQTGIPWIEPLLGAVVLWIAMLGALAATGLRKHIAIDLVSHIFPKRLRWATAVLTDLFAACVCGILGHAGLRYVAIQRELGEALLPGIPRWTIYVIMPVTFLLIATRFVIHAWISTRNAWRGIDPAGPVPEQESPSAAEGA